MGPLFGISGCPRCPVTLAMAVGAAVAHSGRLRGPAILLQACCKVWKLVDRWKDDRPVSPFFASSDHLL
eukprot:8982023-Alexandrium_andersonii.AAC.1